MKFILISAGNNSLEVLFDPQTSEFYSFAVELEDEQDEILLEKASQLAHSVFPKDLSTLEVTHMHSQRSDGHNSLPSISTAGGNVCLVDFFLEEAP